MMRSFRRIFYACIVFAALFGVVRLYFYATDDFRISNISYSMPYQKRWEIPSQTQMQEEKLQEILDQQFTYLGKGAQSYAFASDDGNYVIKFFKFKHLRPSWFQEMLPSIGMIRDFKEKQAARKQRKLYGVFNGYKVAYDLHKQESGLLFIQLNISGNPHREVVVRDKLGLKRTISLQHIPFIIQKKGVTLRVVLNKLLQHNDTAAAKERIRAIFSLYRSEYQKGIYDHDHGVMYNTGFIDKDPLHLDVGKMVRDDAVRNEEIAKKDLFLVGIKMKDWVQMFYPQYFSELSAYIDQQIEQE